MVLGGGTIRRKLAEHTEKAMMHPANQAHKCPKQHARVSLLQLQYILQLNAEPNPVPNPQLYFLDAVLHTRSKIR